MAKTVKCWTEQSSTCRGALTAQAGRFFNNSSDNLDDLVDVSSYITFYVDTVISSKENAIFPNNKTWVTKELKSLLNNKKYIFYTGTVHDQNLVNRDELDAIREAKKRYKDKVELQFKFSSGDLGAAWHGIKDMSSINRKENALKQSVALEALMSVIFQMCLTLF